MYIRPIVITHSSYAISYINVLNDLCLCIKRLYTFPHLYNATPYYKVPYTAINENQTSQCNIIFIIVLCAVYIYR